MANESVAEAGRHYLPLETVNEINELLAKAEAIAWLIGEASDGQAPDDAIPNVGTFVWREREYGSASFAWADCGCGRGTPERAIRRRASRVSPEWTRAVAAQIRRVKRTVAIKEAKA